MCGTLFTPVYAGNKQGSMVREVEEAVVARWNGLSDDELRRLAESVCGQAVTVLRANGGTITSVTADRHEVN